jgi:hypothetical protein
MVLKTQGAFLLKIDSRCLISLHLGSFPSLASLRAALLFPPIAGQDVVQVSAIATHAALA